MTVRWQLGSISWMTCIHRDEHHSTLACCRKSINLCSTAADVAMRDA